MYGYMKLKPLSWYKDLRNAQGRQAAGAFLVEGLRASAQILKSGPRSICEVVAVKNAPLPEGLEAPVLFVNEKQLQAICPSQTPSGICAVVRLPAGAYSETLPEDPGKKILLLEDIQDPGNVGTLLRCAAGFGFNGALLSPGCADPYGPKAVAASAGSLLSLWTRRCSAYLECAEQLKARDYQLIATDLGGQETAAALRPDKKIICALGNEGRGLTRKILALADLRLKIPMDQKKAESLNVAVCGGIVMYLLSRT
jgi:RNA methyltransferase, TrmH family